MLRKALNSSEFLQKRKIRSFYCIRALNLPLIQGKEPNLNSQIMKNLVLCLLLCALCPAMPRAQQLIPIPKAPPKKGQSNAILFNASLPLAVFQRSHFAGAGLAYSWSHFHFGARTAPPHAVGLTFKAGGDYYFGKEVETAGYPFRYDGYIQAHMMAGAIYNPWSNTAISLTAGPVLGLYKGNTEMGLGVDLAGLYFIDQKWGVGPALAYRRQSSNTDALWAFSIRASYLF
jgi:hypothetical protein